MSSAHVEVVQIVVNTLQQIRLFSRVKTLKKSIKKP